MSCQSCSSQSTNNNETPIPNGCKSNGNCGSGSSCNKLHVFDWLSNMLLPSAQEEFDIVEVRFKNTRKEFYKNVNKLPLQIGDAIAVEAYKGHDIGVVSLTGELVKIQMRHKKTVDTDIKKIYRKAKQSDINLWQEAQKLEYDAMFKARTKAIELGLKMKISDTEYQADKTKITIYYTAEGRVDFRVLIKVLSDTLKIRIEMKQVGMRQEAGKLGGIGSCGRELCCSTWLTDFRAVNISAARYQQLSLNPTKLAGQCGKLKCCLNFELDSYLDALKEFPDVHNTKLLTKKGAAFHQKTDIFKKIIWWSYTDEPEVFLPLTIDRTNIILKLNSQNQKPEALLDIDSQLTKPNTPKPISFANVVGQDALTRFDNKKKRYKPKYNANNAKPQANK